jgi:rod shape-determining protein MreC
VVAAGSQQEDVKRLEIDTRRGAGRPVLLVVLVVLALLITTVWYREGDSGPLHATRRAVLTVTEPFAVAGNVIASPLRALGNWVSGSAESQSDYNELKKQNLDLKQRLAALTEAKLQNDRIQALVSFASTQGLKSVGANVIGRPTDAWDGSITIDRGSSAGVRVGDPVVAAGGLLGQVVVVGVWDAKVRLITAQDSGVSVLVQRTRAEGIVQGSVDRSLSLDFVAKTSVPVRGDVLVTSGLGGVYPKGIVVGEVTDVSSQQADVFPQVAVASRVALDSVEEVLVLTGGSASAGVGGGE